MLETDSPETINECDLWSGMWHYAGYANGINVGALIEKGIRHAHSTSFVSSTIHSIRTRLIGNGQAPVHRYWKEILKDDIRTGEFDPSLYVVFFFLWLQFFSDLSVSLLIV